MCIELLHWTVHMQIWSSAGCYHFIHFHPFSSISQKPSLYHVFFVCRPSASAIRKWENFRGIGSLDPMTSPKKCMKMPRAMDPSRRWSRMTTPFRNWEASLQQFRTMDALLENAEKIDKKWLTIAHTHTCTEHCHGELGRPPDFWLSHEVRTRQRETQKVSIGVYVYYIYEPRSK